MTYSSVCQVLPWSEERDAKILLGCTTILPGSTGWSPIRTSRWVASLRRSAGQISNLVIPVLSQVPFGSTTLSRLISPYGGPQDTGVGQGGAADRPRAAQVPIDARQGGEAKYTLIRIDLSSGRSFEAKKALYQAIVRNLEPLGILGDHIKIILRGTPADN